MTSLAEAVAQSLAVVESSEPPTTETTPDEFHYECRECGAKDPVFYEFGDARYSLEGMVVDRSFTSFQGNRIQHLEIDHGFDGIEYDISATTGYECGVCGYEFITVNIMDAIRIA